ncbi:MAG: diguanylate cyclase, partial [Betaproteobacteria bacterium]|nr:diguanylate cyclase [Betaproteobacteria bacterium]
METTLPAAPDVASPPLAERIALLAEFLPESLWLVDVAERRVVYANQAYEKTWGSSRERLFADRFDWLNRVHPEEVARLRAAIHRHPHGGLDIRFRILGEGGEMRWLHMKSFAIGDGERPHTIGGIAFDVTDTLAAEVRAHHLTHFDVLTGLPNRNQFRHQLSEILNQAEHHGHRVALFCMGLDSFQSINENLGYKVGDSTLAVLAQRLRANLRAGDAVCRLGGDQFGIIVLEPESLPDISHTARRLIEVIAAPMQSEGHDVYLGASIGVATYPEDGSNGDQLLYRAEAAMQDAKRAGGNCFHLFEPTANERAQARLQTEQALRQAVGEEQFVVYYQPKVSCSNGSIIGAEALVRWQHPQRGLVSPSEFIPVMEETGLVIALGNWVLRQACLQAVHWKDLGINPITVAVNLSARQLHEGNLYQRVKQVLEETGLPSTWLE